MQNRQKAEGYADILRCEMPWKKTAKRENEIDTNQNNKIHQ